MSLLFLILSVLSLCLSRFIEANVWNVPRKIFTDKDTVVKNMTLPKDGAPVRILLGDQPDTVTVVGTTYVKQFNFQNLKMSQEKKVLLSDCQEKNCNYHIAMAHGTMKTKEVLLCEAAGRKVFACCMNVTDESPTCTSSKQTQPIDSTKGGINIKEGEPSVLVESGEKADLYVTSSGSEGQVGIHKFGEHRVGPASHNKEQYYVGLIPVKQGGDPTHDKLYAFYREKNSDSEPDSDKWLPFVSRVCMADVGGPKNNLQFSWTSQTNARLFCGDPDQKQHFSELLDVATVKAEWWPDTRVYGLFRNEWGMSAVCVYSMRDINETFATSPFSGSSERPRKCVKDSRKISSEILEIIKQTSELKAWVRPENNAAPLLLNHHNYTHIYVDGSQHQRKNEHTVLFLTENNGGIHKVMHGTSQMFVIAEYRPLNRIAHIISITLDPSSMKLYMTTESDTHGWILVQVDVANCGSYGENCEDCVLARDPYCGWNEARCIPKTHGSLQDVTGGDYTICLKPQKAHRHGMSTHTDKGGESVLVPAESRYFLTCPVSSHHAQHTWRHGRTSTSCILNAAQCMFLINSMNHEHEGTYQCVSKERGFTKVLVEVELQMQNRAAGRLSGPLVWVCLLALLTGSL